MEKKFIRVEEVAKELDVSAPYAYKIIRQRNDELQEKGFITIAGRVNRQYFSERFYGAERDESNAAYKQKASGSWYVMTQYTDWTGEHKHYSPSYLKTLHNQLSAIFNHAVRFYDLHSNPAAKAGNMGNEERKEMLFWTKAEYRNFSEKMMDKPLSYYAFEILYWTGIREGELLALTPADFDFERCTVKISKTYQRLKKTDVIISPKTRKSNRTLQIKDFDRVK